MDTSGDHRFTSSAPSRGGTEQPLFRMRPNARRLFWSALALVTVCGAAGYGLVVVRESWQALLVLSIAVLALLLLVLVPLLRWGSRRIEITPTRVVLRSGVLTRTAEEVLLARCTGIVVRRTWFQAMARCADIHLRTLGGEAGVMRDAPHPRQTAALLRELIQRQPTVPSAGPY